MEKTTRRTAEKMKLILPQKRKAPEESAPVEIVQEEPIVEPNM